MSNSSILGSRAVDRQLTGQAIGTKAFWVALALITTGRLLYLWVFRFDLVPDETYYWDWGRQLDWGYFSKPPMIAWLMALVSWVGKNSVIGIKSFAVVLSSGSLIFMYLLAKRMYGPTVGFWAVMAAVATPGNSVMSLFLTIDLPLFLFWCGAIYSFWRVLEEGGRAGYWPLITASMAGFGLLSKQTMLVFFLLALVFLATSREDRTLLRRSGLYVYTIGSLSFLVPTIWWNSQHDWITFQHTMHHFAGNSFALSDVTARFLGFAGGQLFIISPVTGVLLVSVAAGCLLMFRHLGRRERFLLIFSGLPLFVVGLMTIRQRILVNWPAVFYAMGVILLAGWAMGGFSLQRRIDTWRRAFKPGFYVGAGLTLATYVMPFAIVLSSIDGSRLDPLVRLKGWKTLGQKVGALYAEFPEPERTLVTVVGPRQLASELAFYMPTQPTVYRWSAGKQIRSQYDVWGGPRGKEGWDGLIIVEGPDRNVPPTLAQAFLEIIPLKNVESPVGNYKNRRVSTFRGVHLVQWP